MDFQGVLSITETHHLASTDAVDCLTALSTCLGIVWNRQRAAAVCWAFRVVAGTGLGWGLPAVPGAGMPLGKQAEKAALTGLTTLASG